MEYVISYINRGVMTKSKYKGRPISNLVRYGETAIDLRYFAWTLLFLNPATIQRYTFLPSVLDLEKSFKVEVGWLS